MLIYVNIYKIINELICAVFNSLINPDFHSKIIQTLVSFGEASAYPLLESISPRVEGPKILWELHTTFSCLRPLESMSTQLDGIFPFVPGI